MDCEEDDSSLLQLSHSLLPADGTSTSVSSSGQSQQGQVNNWPGQETANDISGNFSPVSPPSGYNNQNHEISESPSNQSKSFSNRTSNARSLSRTNLMMGYSRPERSMLPMSFTSQDPSASFSVTPSNSSDFVLNPPYHGGGEPMNLYYDQAHSFRNVTNLYGGHHSLDQVSSGGEDFQHAGQHLDASRTNAAAVLNHPGYNNDHGLLGLDRSQSGESMVEAMTQNSHGNNHPNSGDIMSVTPNFFDVRSKQMDYSKEMSMIYESSTSKSSTGLHQMPSDRRPEEVTNLVNEIDFSVSSQDFAAMTVSVSSSINSQSDATPFNRSVQELDLRPEGNTYNFRQDQPLKYSRASALSPEVTDSMTRRSVTWSYSGFQSNPQQHQDQHHLTPAEKVRFGSNLKKIALTDEADSEVKEQDLGMQFQRLGNPVKLGGSSARIDSSVDENQSSNAQSSHPSKESENWSGRTRAHRKMARLLGQTSFNEMTTKSQTSTSVTSRPLQLPKTKASALQVQKDQDMQPKFLAQYSQASLRDVGNDAQIIQGCERDARSVSYSLEHDQGSKRNNDLSKHQGSLRDMNLHASLGLAGEGQPVPVSREPTSLLGNHHLLTTSHLDLDFPQTLTLDSSHDPVSHDDLFNNPMDAQQISQQNLTFPDNINPQNSQDLSLESYLNSASDKDLDIIRKCPDQVQRDLTTDNDFDFEEYIENTRLAQSYFDRSSNLPQDMTMYQKSCPDKFGASHNTLLKTKERDSFQSGKIMPKPTGLSELHKELIKTSTKESQKGIRIPRDINRAMEILQDMQEDERVEMRRKGLQKQTMNETPEPKDQQHQHQHQHQQNHQQHQMHNHQPSSINSSPKKTFQNKHQIESLGLTDQQLLEPASFIEEHFLDQPPLGFSETQQQANSVLCEPSLQDLSTYSAFQVGHQVPEMDLSVINKRDHQQTEAYQNVNPVLDNHMLKKLAMSTPAKDMAISQSPSSSTLNNNTVLPPGHDLSFNLLSPPTHLSDQFTSPNDNLSNRLSMSVNYSLMESERMRHNALYQNKDADVDKSQGMPAFRNDVSDIGSKGVQRETSLVGCPRQALYAMMKQGQLCDAMLSVSQQSVKVHQVILCSMSNYLCNLLLKTQPISQQQSSYSSSLPTSYGVTFVINCEMIKSSSVSAFLMFIYLGRTDFTESNVVDLFILASSLHVAPLKELCQQYMWKVHISAEQMKIPPVHIVKSGLDQQNQSCQVNLAGDVAMEDKCVNTGNVKSMPAATQTDKSTSGVGRGGQEEWVMLKKTKQKTVSPSKTKYGSIGKSTVTTDSISNCRHGKKGWLSPKRRFKTEQHLNQSKMDNSEQDTIKEKFADVNPVTASSVSHDVTSHLTSSNPPSSSSTFTDVPHPHSHQSSSSSEHPDTTRTEVKPTESMEIEHNTETHPNQGVVSTNQNTASIVTPRPQRTTVEIAEEAAATKSAAHSYGTRFSGRGANKQSISYSALANGYDKKKAATNSREKPSLIKKKDFVKSHTSPIQSTKLPPSVSSLTSKSLERRKDKDSPDGSHNSPIDSSRTNESNVAPVKGPTVTSVGTKSRKSVIGKPLKKNIAQRAQDSEMAEDPRNKKKQSHVADSGLLPTEDPPEVMDVSVSASSSLSSSSPIMTEGDLTNVSSFIDSIVNTFESEGGEADLQIVLGALDSEFGHTLLPTISTSSITTASISSAKPSVSSIQVQEISPPRQHQQPAQYLQTLATSSTTTSSPSSSCMTTSLSESAINHNVNLKKSTTPQGYRKRLIQLMKSENAKDTAENSREEEFMTGPKNVKNGQECDLEDKNSTDQSDPLPPSSPSSVSNPKESQIGVPNCGTGGQQKEAAEHQSLSDANCGPDLKVACDKVSEGDLSSKYEEETQFHKIFKRKRKAKFRKTLSNEIESLGAKNRAKKCQASDQEGGNSAKVRQRRNTANDSDSASSKPKVRKTTLNDTDSHVMKVRPPPKKRAKMELELMKVANKKLDPAAKEGKEGKEEGPEPGRKGDSKKNKADADSQDIATSTISENCNILHHEPLTGKSIEDDHSRDTCTVQSKERKDEKNCAEKSKKEMMKTGQRAKDTVVQGGKPQVKNKKLTNNSKEMSACVKILEDKLKQSKRPSQLFTCEFCQVQLKSAQCTVKHVMLYHDISVDEVLDNIAIGQGGKAQEACDICGYVTKDTTYKYMHYHKYFKHNVPLPKGWSSCKCQICNKEFHANFLLKDHIRSHSDTFFFVCWYCGQNFKTRNSFNSHIFHRHSEERRHVCKICNKTFKTWTQLKIHVRSHTGERPFTCTECSYGSTTQGNMKYHLSSKHGFEKAKVEECMKKVACKTSEMNPAALEALMSAVIAKTIPDKALKEPKKRSPRAVKKESNQKERNEHKQCSTSRYTKKEIHEKTTTTSSSVTAQVKAFLTDKASALTSTSDSSLSSSLLSSFSTSNVQTYVSVSKDSPSASNSKEIHHKPRRKPAILATKRYSSGVPQVSSSNQMAVFPPSLPLQDQTFRQSAPAVPSTMCGYTLLPTHLLMDVPGSSSFACEGTSNGTSSLVLVSSSNLLPAGTVMETQENANFQIPDVNAAVPPMNIVLSDSTNSVPSQFIIPTGSVTRVLPGGNNTLVLETPKNGLEDSSYLASSSQSHNNPYLMYANSSVAAQASQSEAVQPGLQPLLISYSGLPTHQPVQGLPQLHLAKEGVSATSGELIPVLLTEQMMGATDNFENGVPVEVLEGQQEEMILTLQVAEVANKELKKEEIVISNTEPSTENQSIVLSSSEKPNNVVLLQEVD